MKTEVITLSERQHRVLDIINKANAGFMTVEAAAKATGLSKRQVQRKKKTVREEGAKGLEHKNRNRKPSHAIPEETRKEILKIRGQAGYGESNFAHFRELLETKHEIKISYSALYNLLRKAGIQSPKTRRRFKVHRRRKRRSEAGSLIQMDASPFAWLGTGEMCEMHGGIDDSTGQITGLYLCKHECMLGYHEVMRRMIGTYGVPAAIYADRHTIFRSPNEDKAKAVDSAAGTAAHQTQFGRALSELGIQLIAARSPQAKGRIERLWGTLQSRLPVEFRIQGIQDIQAANEFLETYIYAFNSEFAIEPESGDSMFLPLDERKNLDHILCVKETRILDRGLTLSYHGQSLCISPADHPQAQYLPPRATMTVMASPRIGIKAAYRNIVFDTAPAPKPRRPPKNPPKKKLIPPAERGTPWEPKVGLPWAPGLQSYKECFQILTEIFLKPLPPPRS